MVGVVRICEELAAPKLFMLCRSQSLVARDWRDWEGIQLLNLSLDSVSSGSLLGFEMRMWHGPHGSHNFLPDQMHGKGDGETHSARAPPDSLELSVNKATNHNEPPSQVYCTRNSDVLTRV